MPSLKQGKLKKRNPHSIMRAIAFLEETKRSGCYEFHYLELTTGMRLGKICVLENDLSLKTKR